MDKAALTLVIIGALNWGLISLFNWDIVRAIFDGNGTTTYGPLSRIVFGLVGIAGLYAITLLFSDRVDTPEKR